MIRTFILLIVAIAITGCSVTTSGISQSLERRLRSRSITAEQFGIRTGNGGEEMELFSADLDRAPISVPLVRGVVGLPAVDVRLNQGSEIRMILDTGAQLSVVEAKRAAEAKAHVFASEKKPFRVIGVGGEELAWLARFDRVFIGPMKLRNFIAVLRRSKTNVRFAGLPMGGLEVNLLGSPTFSGFNHVTVDYPRKRVVFSAGTDFSPESQAHAVPMAIREGLFYVPLRVGKHTVPAMVDTGAKDQVFLNQKLLKTWNMESLATKGRPYRAAGIGGETSGRQFPMPLIFLGDEPVRDVIVDAGTGPWSARIGTELLARWRVTFDFRNNVMWLE
ncbi:MAG: hypothetical protein RL088_3380 [Verrucomicrobiota bacterium]